jgi:hypothetical protein
MTMNLKTKLVLAIAAVSLLSAPASARIDGDEGGASAYPFFNGERGYAPKAAWANGNSARAYASGHTVRPRAAKPRYER